MKTFRVPIVKTIYGFIYVNAEDKTELMNKMTKKYLRSSDIEISSCDIDFIESEIKDDVIYSE